MMAPSRSFDDQRTDGDFGWQSRLPHVRAGKGFATGRSLEDKNDEFLSTSHIISGGGIPPPHLLYTHDRTIPDLKK